ncbi:hypothetical protein SH1V18_18340 [Vallitalea longa]|uniref:Uncharacterized protein n=1 Tax=Vallitalea longa TaxID=2936439 RepID=A0A9W5YA37_9FIRM|nr:hypothetical protein [Vallitalea longa]GKX29354.1 hypothetical protein SH1V18_18340 [Vallitalea longa]
MEHIIYNIEGLSIKESQLKYMTRNLEAIMNRFINIRNSLDNNIVERNHIYSDIVDLKKDIEYITERTYNISSYINNAVNQYKESEIKLQNELNSLLDQNGNMNVKKTTEKSSSWYDKIVDFFQETISDLRNSIIHLKDFLTNQNIKINNKVKDKAVELDKTEQDRSKVEFDNIQIILNDMPDLKEKLGGIPYSNKYLISQIKKYIYAKGIDINKNGQLSSKTLSAINALGINDSGFKVDEKILNDLTKHSDYDMCSYFNRPTIEYSNSKTECCKDMPHSVTFMTCDIDKLSSPQKKAIEGLIKEYNNYNTPHLLDSIFGTDNPEHRAEMQEIILDDIQRVIDLSDNEDFKTYISVRNRIVEPINGALQAFGGATEAITGSSIAVGASWTGIGIPIGVGGSYIAVDGASNVLGGISRFKNGLMGSTEGDEWNFMKNAYVKLFPTHGETIYNLTQLGIGVFTIGKGISELPDDAVKVYPRAKHIKKAQTQGLKTESVVLDLKDKVIITTQEINPKTATPMILQKTVIDKTKLKQGSKLIIGVSLDEYNVNGAIESLKNKEQEDD